MIALDTNLLVRILTNDDPGQAERARGLMASGPTWIAKTVLLELAWVLHSSMGYSRHQIAGALRSVVGSATVTVEDPAAIGRALDWFAGGMDFSDALHLASAGSSRELATFDGDFAKHAKKAGARPTVRKI